ncbi:TBC-domain-containing protein [Jaminaea rosea]|uniref:TBC-domain-containing protein n=1 Tax=Jaminaea rosea TaxID=1569628 RepID=A0A316UYL8_9BASI|nr:TBC-domain-containing protein [Jaminaea rosea]PWN28235.1 TBC-domain-containing protein [Jaminaea rosea]
MASPASAPAFDDPLSLSAAGSGSASTDTLRSSASPLARGAGRHYFDLKAISDQQASSSSRSRQNSIHAGQRRGDVENAGQEEDDEGEDEGERSGALTPTSAPSLSSRMRRNPSRPPSRSTDRAPSTSRPSSPSIARPPPSIATMWSQDAHIDRHDDVDANEEESRSSWLARLHKMPDTELAEATTIRASSSSQGALLCRELSAALSESTTEVNTLNEALERLTRQFEDKLELQRRTYETREKAMRSVCSQHGVPTGALDRAIARAVAEMPRVSMNVGDESDSPASRTLRVPSSSSSTSRPISTLTTGGGGGDRSSRWIQAAEANDEASPSLPFSLQEAMLDGLTGSASSTATTTTRTRSSTNRSESAYSVATTSASGSSIVSRRPSSAARRPSAKASEDLMAWRTPNKDSRKASATTQATTNATPTLEGGGGSAEGESAFSFTSASNGDAAKGGGESTLRHQPSAGSVASTSSAATSNRSSSSSFLTSLAWRRKKPSPAPGPPPPPVLPASSTIKASRTAPPPAASVAPPAATLGSPPPPPLARTASGSSGDVAAVAVALALHEAIEDSPPTSKQLNLPHHPHPPHVKALFLATRIMGPDSSSSNLLADRGRKVSDNVASMAQRLVRNVREEELEVREGDAGGTQQHTTTTTRRLGLGKGMPGSGPTSPRVMSPKQRPVSMAFQAASAIMDAASAPAKDSSSNVKATRKGKSNGKGKPHAPATPNVTRVPQLSGSGSRLPFSSTKSPRFASVGTDANADGNVESGARPPVELESIVPLEGKPPTLALRPRAPKASRGPLGGGAFPSTSDDDEASGDEFEVYGGKSPFHPQRDRDQPIGGTSSKGAGAGLGNLDDRAVDVFGFVYDATPSDVRLLRQARKASTPAPACLTGVRVGVGRDEGEEGEDDEGEGDSGSVADANADGSVRSTSATREEDEDAASSFTSHSRSETASLQELPPVDWREDDEGDQQQGGAPRRSRKRLLGKASPAPPSTGATSLVVSRSRGDGPTSPEEERREFQLFVGGQDDAERAGRGEDVDKGRQDKQQQQPKAISETIKSLLDQLKLMHAQHQAEQMVQWGCFLSARNLAMRRGSSTINGDVDGAAHGSGTGGDEYQSGLVGYRTLSPSERQQFVRLCESGVPLSLRSKVWHECSGASEMAEPGLYRDLLEEHSASLAISGGGGGNGNVNDDVGPNPALMQIDLDIHRTMPTNIYFGGDGPGVPKLRRVLAAYSYHNPTIGYCQGMNNLAATLLLTHAEEEEAFWVLACLLERVVPEGYYTSHLVTSQADQRVLVELVRERMPGLMGRMEALGVDLPAVSFAWFLSLYTDCLPVETLFRVWDLLFVEGSIVLFRVALAILIMNERDLIATGSLAEFYGMVHSMTSRLFNVDRLVQLACHDLRNVVTEEKIEARRKVHVADIRAELGLDEEAGGE